MCGCVPVAVVVVLLLVGVLVGQGVESSRPREVVGRDPIVGRLVGRVAVQLLRVSWVVLAELAVCVFEAVRFVVAPPRRRERRVLPRVGVVEVERAPGPLLLGDGGVPVLDVVVESEVVA